MSPVLLYPRKAVNVVETTGNWVRTSYVLERERSRELKIKEVAHSSLPQTLMTPISGLKVQFETPSAIGTRTAAKAENNLGTPSTMPDLLIELELITWDALMGADKIMISSS